MAEAAASAGTQLSVNQTRRLYPTNLKVRELIHDGTLGQLQSIEYIDGDVFNWPTASGFYFEPGAPGGLSDRGIHSLDLICWWLDAKPDLISAQTDSFGGPESLARVRLDHAGCQIDLKLSWLTALQNTFKVVGDRATVEGHIGQWRAVTLTPSSGSPTKIKLAADEVGYNDFGIAMISNFLDVLTRGSSPTVPAASVLAGTELIDESYGRAERMTLPWLFGGQAS
jgi:predicted dehydrogenase